MIAQRSAPVIPTVRSLDRFLQILLRGVLEIGHESRSNLTFCFILFRDIVIAMRHEIILSLRFENYQFIPVKKSFKTFNDERDGVCTKKRGDRECSTLYVEIQERISRCFYPETNFLKKDDVQRIQRSNDDIRNCHYETLQRGRTEFLFLSAKYFNCKCHQSLGKLHL